MLPSIGATKLGFALLLKLYTRHGRFPTDRRAELPSADSRSSATWEHHGRSGRHSTGVCDQNTTRKKSCSISPHDVTITTTPMTTIAMTPNRVSHSLNSERLGDSRPRSRSARTVLDIIDLTINVAERDVERQ